MVDLARGHGCVAKVLFGAVGGVQAAAGGNAVGWVIHTAEPAGVVVHPTATQLGREENHIPFERQFCHLKQLHKNGFQATPGKQLEVRDFKIRGKKGFPFPMMTYPVLQVVNRVAHLVLGVVVQDGVSVRPVKGPLYLRRKRRRKDQLTQCRCRAEDP